MGAAIEYHCIRCLPSPVSALTPAAPPRRSRPCHDPSVLPAVEEGGRARAATRTSVKRLIGGVVLSAFFSSRSKGE